MTNNKNTSDEFEEETEYVSKTRIKKEMLALTELGKKLVDLPENALKKIPLDSHLKESVELARRIKAHGGKKRQLQYIGKLLRTLDTEEIEQALNEREAGHQQQTRHFHMLEQWRDKLLQDEQALQQLITEYPDIPIQETRQLIRQAKKEKEQNKPPKSARKLFSLLRDCLSE